MNSRAPGSRSGRAAQPGEPRRSIRDPTAGVLGELDALLRECPRQDLPGCYAALQARIGVVIGRLLDLDDSRASRPTNATDTLEKRYFRVREVMKLIGLTKPKVFQALKEHKLDGFKLDGVLLITVGSVERYLRTATPWKPKG